MTGRIRPAALAAAVSISAIGLATSAAASADRGATTADTALAEARTT